MDLRICRICLDTNAKVYKLDRFQLKSYYEEVLAQKVSELDGLPQCLCYECATLLHKYHKFKEKCFLGQKVLKEMLWNGPISYEEVYKIDRITYGLQSLVKLSTAKDKINVLSLVGRDDSDTVDIKAETQDYDLVDSAGDVSMDDEYQDEQDGDDIKIEDDVLLDKDSLKPVDKALMLADIKREEKGVGKSKRKRQSKNTSSIYPNRKKIKHYSEDGEEIQIKDMILKSEYWEVFQLSEEEAVKEFKAKSEGKRYKESRFKCDSCYKGFSKEMILKRHNQLRHHESVGKFQCRFCHVRFHLYCYVKKHTRQHYSRYKCLRCSLVCELEYTAFLHDEYHRGVVRKCNYCDQEFRHSSSYYTHLRRHRSEFVCALCGASFVSAAGLHQHKRITHVVDDVDIDDDDDDESVNTYCERCDIRFETRKAYKEHLIHSVMHEEGAAGGLDNGETIPKIIPGKEMHCQITDEMRKIKPLDEKKLPAYNRRDRSRSARPRRIGKYNKLGRKPTTCNQCGKSFDTQMACMRHHREEHPRTPFSSERVICEICGVSLALGSVSSHQNMHTREVVHSCGTCGRQFHSSVSYKRHQLTHTGAKPFSCQLCDKRFTQSNSAKLHYRTFHLKEPYPKRNRRKKPPEIPEAPETVNHEGSGESADGGPQPREPQRPAAAAPVDYLTLQ